MTLGDVATALGSDLEDRDGLVELATATPTATLHALTGWATARGVELPGLTVTRPSLEDMFLTLTSDAEDRA